MRSWKEALWSKDKCGQQRLTIEVGVAQPAHDVEEGPGKDGGPDALFRIKLQSLLQ